MKIIRTLSALRRELDTLGKTKTIGFVPTMGALHEGHLSLVRRSRRENDLTVVSIFVNPLQFGPQEDFRRYPRDLRKDAELLKPLKVDLLYAPDEKRFYDSGFQTTVTVSEVSRTLCGRSRPIHFRGVATVVLKLLNQVRPTVLYLGQKDYQQYIVVKRMTRDLNFPVRVQSMPIVREADGLAMSSRNVFLEAQERAQAVLLRRSLDRAEALVVQGEKKASKLKAAMRAILKKASRARIDYIEIVDAATLRDVVQLKKGAKSLIALAVVFSKTRLIDNTLIGITHARHSTIPEAL